MRPTATFALAMAFIMVPLPLSQLVPFGSPAPEAPGVPENPAPDLTIPWFYDDMRPPVNPPPGFVMPESYARREAARNDAGKLPDYSTMTVTDEQLDGPAGARTTYPLLRNNSLSLSFEWDATVGEFQDMEAGLKRFSNLVYDYTDGQFTIGRFEIYNNKANWGGVNIHVLNKSWYRANANYGGLYWGGIIQIGRDAWGERWNTPMGAVTLAHEFGHYGLWLPDEYVEATQVSLCNNNNAGTCIMSDPYSYFEICTDESHDAVHTGDSNSCWNYIKYYFPNVVEVHGAPDPGPSTGPGSTVNWHYQDLSLSSSEMGVTPSKINEDDNITVSLPLHNSEQIVTGTVSVRFYLDMVTNDNIIRTLALSVGGQSTIMATISWQAVGGSHTLIAIADPDNKMMELSKTNNQASKQVTVNGRPRISAGLTGFTSPEDIPLTVKMTSYATDAEDAQGSLRWSVLKSDARALASITGQNSANQTLIFRPVLHWWGNTRVTVAVTDSGNLMVSKDIDITFTFVNYPPVAQEPSISSPSVLRGRTVEISSGASDVEDKEVELVPLFEWRPNGSADWKKLEGTFDGSRFKALLNASPDSALGRADVRVAFQDTLNTRGPWSYVNSSLDILNDLPEVLDIGLSDPAVIRGGLVTLYLNATDLETARDELRPEVEFSVAEGEWQPLDIEGEYIANSWTYSLDVNRSWAAGPYDFRAMVRDADGGASPWMELPAGLVVSNSLPGVDSARTTRTKLLRNESATISVTGGDYETPSPDLTLEIRVRDPRGREPPGYTTKPRWGNVSWEARFQPPAGAMLGKYILSVRLVDADGGWSEWRDISPAVEVGNNLPVAAFVGPDTAVQGDLVRFDGVGSYDLENHLNIMSFSWNFGDGSPAGAGQTASHSFSRPGTFRVTLTLTDKDGAASTAQRTINIREKPPESGLAGGGVSIAIIGFIAIAAAGAGAGAFLMIRKRKAAPAAKPLTRPAPPSGPSQPSQRIEAVPARAAGIPAQPPPSSGGLHQSMVHCRQEHAEARRAVQNAEEHAEEEAAKDSKSDPGPEPVPYTLELQPRRPPGPKS